MREQVGKVILDYTYYPGEDYYCDGKVEDELLTIVKNHPASEFPRIIEERRSWPILYHLSPLRGNIVEWFPMKEGAKVLEVGSGCGAITATLAKKAGSLTCIDLSKKRSLINAYRNRDAENLTIYVGNFKDVEQGLEKDFDYIFLIGVLEYGQLYIDSHAPYEDFIKILCSHLKEGGQLIVAIENKFGLKYWAGCAEDHLGTYFSGIENYTGGDGIRTFTRNGLEKLLSRAGVGKAQFYYPYPDYKLMTTLYSDEYLPKKGELSNNLRNYDRPRLLLFDEKEAFDGILEEGLFPLYSNSYLFVLGGKTETTYVKYSNDRRPECCIRTEIKRTKEGAFKVQKFALGEQAEPHIRGIESACRLLKERYEGSGLKINECEPFAGGIAFPFAGDRTLEELLDDYLDQKDEAGFEALFVRYFELVSYHSEKKVTDLDLIFSNILVDGDTWTLIDYEWTLEEAVAPKEVAFRALYCYLIGAERRREISFRLMEKYLGITMAELDDWVEKEKAFQDRVTGKRLSMVTMRDAIGKPVYGLDVLTKPTPVSRAELRRVQIYEDFGQGFSEEQSYFLDEKDNGESLKEAFFHLVLSFDDGQQNVRIDPSMTSCIAEVQNLMLDGKTAVLSDERIKLNGNLIFENIILYKTTDPSITVDARSVHTLEADIRITILEPALAEQLFAVTDTAKKKERRGLFK